MKPKPFFYKFIASVLVYNVAIFFTMALVYFLIGMTKHFNLPDGTGGHVGTALYFAMVTHTTTGYGDISPKTGLARSLVTLHMSLVWLQASSALILAGMV